MIKYPVIIEKANLNYSAYCPDLPGCVATGATVEETVERIKEAIQFHIKTLKKEGQLIPSPSTKVRFIDVSV